MWANFVRDVIIIAFFVAVGMPIELCGDSWNHRRLQNSKSTRAKDNNVGAQSAPAKNGGVNYNYS